MVLHWDEYQGIVKWVVLYSDSAGTKLVWVYKGVLHFISITYCLINDKDCCRSRLRVVICCDCFHNWHTFYLLICIRVWEHIKLFICVVHDDEIGSTCNSFHMRVQLYLYMYNVPSDLRSAVEFSGNTHLYFSRYCRTSLWKLKNEISKY